MQPWHSVSGSQLYTQGQGFALKVLFYPVSYGLLHFQCVQSARTYIRTFTVLLLRQYFCYVWVCFCIVLRSVLVYCVTVKSGFLRFWNNFFLTPLSSAKSAVSMVTVAIYNAWRCRCRKLKNSTITYGTVRPSGRSSRCLHRKPTQRGCSDRSYTETGLHRTASARLQSPQQTRQLISESGTCLLRKEHHHLQLPDLRPTPRKAPCSWQLMALAALKAE